MDKDSEGNETVRWFMGHYNKHPEWDLDMLISLGNPNCDLYTLKLSRDLSDVSDEQFRGYARKAMDLCKKRDEEKKKMELQMISDPNIRIHLDPELNTNYFDKYEEHIQNTLGFEVANSVRSSCETIIQRLSLGDEYPVVKGLVHGSVQSGKTANMAGLIAMAADYGFNIFIVFTGNITALNDQNFNRFRNDLRGNPPFTFVKSGNLDLISFDEKTLCVSLKTNARIRKIIKWLSKVKSDHQKYKILIIDDEADYASINTAKAGSTPSGTNRLLRYLVDSKDKDGRPVGKSGYKAVNYVAFTATPYANLLNESENETLYPGDFIFSLPKSNRYFGLSQIFGVDTYDVSYNGLPIVNTSPSMDHEFRLLEKGRPIRFRKNSGKV